MSEKNTEIINLIKKFSSKLNEEYTKEEQKDYESVMLASVMKDIFEIEQYADDDPFMTIHTERDLFTAYIWLLCYYKLDLNVIKFEFTKEELDNFSWYWLLERFGKNLKKNQLNMVFNKKEFRDDFNNRKLYYKEQFFEYLNLYLVKRDIDVKEKIIDYLELGINEELDWY